MSTPSPFTVTNDGCHYEVKVDAHYISDENMQTLRRYITALNDENERLRELVRDMFRDFANADNELRQRHGRTFMARTRYESRLRELGIEVDA